MRWLAIAAFITVSGCASPPPGTAAGFTRIDFSRRPADWPELKVEIRSALPEQLLERCGFSHAPAGQKIYGCAQPYFCLRTCTVWLSTERLPKHQAEPVFGHERAHCRGYDHFDSTVLADEWADAKARGCGPELDL